MNFYRYFALSVALVWFVGPAHSIPSTPHYFEDQLVDHFSESTATFSQRFYMNDTFFKGAGSPIFCIMGGEGAIEPSTGIFYPFVVDMAEKFGALVIEPEHRFYGESLPVKKYSTEDLSLLNTQQALADYARFIVHFQQKHECTGLNGQKRCPVITVGGSYPGFMSAMMRLRYPAVVDFAYAASAPMRFYSQQVDSNAYYKLITDVAEESYSGCSGAVKKMLQDTLAKSSRADMVKNLNLCEPLPAYMSDDKILAEELMMVVQYTFANLNMGNYPPPNTALKASCKALVNTVRGGDSWGALGAFLRGYTAQLATASIANKMSPLTSMQFELKLAGVQEGTCYDLHTQLPAGKHATISSGDWSGVGVGQNGANWDYQTCAFLVEAIGTNGKTDMFLEREWSYDWLDKHCRSRFGVVPQPRTLADLWGFERLESMPTSHFIFTNGLKDGWSVGRYPFNDISEKEIYVIDIEDGAHHSDLAHDAPGPNDTPAVQKAHDQVYSIISKWLDTFSGGSERPAPRGEKAILI